MASIENRSRFKVTVKNRDDLNRPRSHKQVTHPYVKVERIHQVVGAAS